MDISITKNVSTPSAFPVIGDVLTYTVQITNASSYATGVNSAFRDALPSSLTYLPGSMRIASNNYGGHTGPLTDPIDSDEGNASGNVVNINLGPDATPTAGGTLRPGNTVTVTYQAVINSNAVSGDIITNIGVVTTTSSETGETFVATGESSVTVNAEISVQKNAYPTRVSRGDTVTDTITFINETDTSITDAVIYNEHDSAYFRLIASGLTINGTPVSSSVAAQGNLYVIPVPVTVPVDAFVVLTLTFQIVENAPEGVYYDVAWLTYGAHTTSITPPVPVVVLPTPCCPCRNQCCPCKPCQRSSCPLHGEFHINPCRSLRS